jgi:hypothetical protein
MMSLLNTKPTYAKNVIATDRGWVNADTAELLVSHKNLKTKLEQMNPVVEFIADEPVQPIVEFIADVPPMAESVEIIADTPVKNPAVEAAIKRKKNGR